MTSSIDDWMVDFDIDQFHHSPNYELEKAQKSVALLKTKVTATNGVIRKYYNKQVDFKQLEDHVIATKADYQNVFTENLSLRDKCAASEEEKKSLNDTCKELKEQKISVVNQYEGILSHSKQLQMLVKEKETAIESLNIENQLEKVSAKESEKRSAALQKKLDHLKLNLRRIRDVVLGKKQVTKEIKVFLNKYGKTDDDNTSQAENSSDDIEAFDSCISPSGSEDLELPERKNKTSTKHTDINEENMHTEDDSESNVVSSDTGRGSSLACSLPDSDKSLLSSEYFIHHNPLYKDKVVISIATSPISTPVLTSIATSPIIFGDNCSMQLQEPGPPPANLQEHIKSNRNIPITGVSPIFTTQYDDISKSADRNIQCKTKDSPFKRPRRVTECSFTSDYNIQEAECSDINNLDDESNDGEIQMIFDTMRLHQELITPIPTTPARPRSDATVNTSTQTAHHAGASPDAAVNTYSTQTAHPGGATSTQTAHSGGACPDAAVNTYSTQTAHPGGATSTQTAHSGGACPDAAVNTYSTQTAHPGGATSTQTAHSGGACPDAAVNTYSTQTAHPGGATSTQTAHSGGACPDAAVNTYSTQTAHPGGATSTQTAHSGGACPDAAVNTYSTQTAHPGGATSTQTAHSGGACPDAAVNTYSTQTAHPGGATSTQTAHPGGATSTQTAHPGGATSTQTAHPGGATSTQTAHSGGACPDAAKLTENHIVLKKNLANLEKKIDDQYDNIKKLIESIIASKAADEAAQSLLQFNHLLEENAAIQRHQQMEPKIVPVENYEVLIDTSGVTKKSRFMDKMAKMKELFDDSSPLRSDELVAPLPPIMMLSRSPSPSPCSPPTSPCSPPPAHFSPLPAHVSPPPAHVSPPPAHFSPPPEPYSPPPASPSPSPASHSPSPASHSLPPVSHSSSPASHSPLPATHSPPPSSHSLPPAPLSPLLPARSPNTDETTDNRADSISTFKSKERLRFEEPLSDREMCEYEIVVELAPDTDESERDSLHAILMEQQSKRWTEPEEITVKKISKRKMSRLVKLRNNVLPKCKIKREKILDNKPKAKLRIQPKRLTVNRERVLGFAPAVDSKAAYEEACKIMAELKSENKLTNGTTVNAPNKNTHKSIKLKKTDKFPPLSKEDEGQIRYQNLIRDSFLGIEKSPSILPVKNCFVVNDTSLRRAEKDEQNKATLKTPTKRAAISKCSPAATDLFTPELKKYVITRGQSKCENKLECKPKVTQSNTDHFKSPALKMYGRHLAANKIETNNNNVHKDPIVIEKIVYTEAVPQNRLLKRPACDDKPEIVPKRLFRSSFSHPTESEDDLPLPKVAAQSLAAKDIVSYDDLDIFSNSKVDDQTKPAEAMTNINRNSAKEPDNSKHGILCTFIDKYVSNSMKHPPKVSENNLNVICKLLEDSVAQIQKLPPNDTKQGMDQLVEDLQFRCRKDVISGLIKFLKEPARKDESYNKINVPPAPPMTKVEQILVYVVAQLKKRWPDFDVVENILKYIEYTLFMLNQAPDFDVIETLSHFYAILCRYNKNRNRLRMFIIDAMYCLMYKAVSLIKQCLDVWMHILPLAHLGLAKNPLVICLVYLLHFYKCEDRFNRVQEIRNILHRKYFYEVSEWNEPGILEMLRNTLLELREIPGEKKMIRMSLIILAKRNGATWCQKHIVNNMLLPIIEQANVPDRIKQFCVTLLGPLLKPYPMQLTVNREIVMNKLFDILERNPTPQMEEAVYTSLIYMSRHNQFRVIRALLCWKPKSVSPEFEEILKTFVRERPVKSWRKVVSKIFINNDFK